MKKVFTFLFLPAITSTAFFSTFATSCAENNKKSIGTISIADKDKTQNTKTYEANFVFNCEQSFYIQGVSSEIIENQDSSLEINDSSIIDNKLSLKIAIINFPKIQSTYNFGLKFTSRSQETTVEIHDLTIIYIPEESPIVPIIKCPEYTEITTHLLNDDGDFETKFTGFKYENIPNIDNLSVKGRFDTVGTSFQYFIDAKEENTFDVIISSKGFKKLGTITGKLTFFLDDKQVETAQPDFIIDIYQITKPIPDVYYAFDDTEVDGQNYASVLGYAGPETEQWNCIDIPDYHIKDGKIYHVNSIAKDAFSKIATKCSDVQFLSFERCQHLQSIGDNAFRDCDFLVGDLSFPSTLKSVGASAFRNCMNVGNSLTLPSSLSDIGVYAFEKCIHISKINLFEYGGFPSWCSNRIVDKSFVTNDIFINTNIFGTVYVSNNAEKWKEILINNCALPTQWKIVTREVK